MRVLVCDDEADVRELFRTVLELNDIEVIEAVDGRDCLCKLAESEPDLVLLDLWMPELDGFETLPLIRERCPDCPVVVVTAHAVVDALDRCLARGAVACFDKLGIADRLPRVVEKFANV